MVFDFLRKVFGSGASGGASVSGDPVEYKGYTILPTPTRQGSQWLTCGVISKTFPEGKKEHRFIRAETHDSVESASTFAVSKGQRIIDELGDQVFKSF
jgi:hypothetical protein